MAENIFIANWLQELLAVREAELRERQEFNNFTDEDNNAFMSESLKIKNAIDDLKRSDNSNTNECECTASQLTLDEAICHATEVGNRNDSPCCKQHLQLAQWLTELKDLRDDDRYVRLMADFDNYKKRVAKEKQLDNWNFKKKHMLEVIEVLDDMERVISACHLNELSYEPKDNIDQITNGFMLIVSNMRELLKREGCIQIECNEGDQFDVNAHDAVMTSSPEESGLKEGQVVKVLSSGWKLDGILLRAVKVVVCK